jgi:N utilization substance protein B
MQMLYQWELGGNTPDQVVSTFFLEQKADSEVKRFALDLFQGAVNDIERLDQSVRAHMENWRLERLAAVDRSILRMALCELLHHPETPPKAVINEALEIARRFSGEDSVQFINGVLDAICKSLPPRD